VTAGIHAKYSLGAILERKPWKKTGQAQRRAKRGSKQIDVFRLFRLL
jgi:hypothetical protein